MGDRLWRLSNGEDHRRVTPDHAMKSISNETTFREDISDCERLETYLWQICEKVSARAKEKNIAGRVITLKLKRADHRITTRRQTLEQPTQLAHVLFEHGRVLLHRSINNFSFRLIGLGISSLVSDSQIAAETNLLDPENGKRTEVERLTDQIRARFGDGTIEFGRSFR